MDDMLRLSVSGGCGARVAAAHAGFVAAILVALVLVGLGAQAMAGPPPSSVVGQGHFVPADKRLSPEWLRSLYERGASRLYRGGELNVIGMPIGGIAAGQLYLCGDGTLGCWKIFNQQYFSGYGAECYRPRMPERPVAQGFAVLVEDGGHVWARTLDRQGLSNVEFVGEYPIGRVRYRDDALPVRVELEAFSPFIPLNARDSALPATVLEYTVHNDSDRPLSVALLGWLENAVCFHSTREDGLVVQHRSRLVSDRGRGLLVHTAEPLPAEHTSPREDVVLADFEGDSYGDWTVEGQAFGERPARGTLPNQSPVTGFHGERLVNTFLGGDAPRGRLLSPPFEITRKYICFLIGGGRDPQGLCVNLVVDGQAVRTATGENRERLLWHTWDVRELAGRTAQIEIVDRRSGPWGHINVDQILLSDRQRVRLGGRVEELEDFGSIVLALAEPAAAPELTSHWLSRLGWDDTLVCATRLLGPPGAGRCPAIATPRVELPPQQQRTVTFVLAWHFANRPEGNMYANWFRNAGDVAHYVLDNYERLARQTRLWHETYYDSTLPRWLLDRLHSTVCNLATGTCLWWRDGRFWAWEGVGCCEGTCTHVWNYAQAAARLFPELERSVRQMQDLRVALHDDGLVGFRGARNRWYAADGQVGTVLKCCREHQMSADDSFLREHWPAIKRVLEYSISQDQNEDGLIENSQHNTFDINFEGPNTFVGSLYLAALRAGEEMAREMGDTAFAQRARRIFEAGSQRTIERLWNGEYFVQDVDLAKYPKYQYGPGCLSDQLFGQGWAHQLALGYIYPQPYVRQALESIWKYNWAPDVGPHNAAHRPERWFAQPGEAGLFTCTWPKSRYLSDGVRYREEVWTGIEYQVAGHMIWEGMVEQGLAIVRGVHDRYQPPAHNPFNEVECGDHYARALASWGVYLALCGYEYHGPRGHLGFAPRLNAEDFRAAFTCAEGWGTFAQQRQGMQQRARIELRWGRLRLASLALAAPPPVGRSRVVVSINQQHAEVDVHWEDERLVIRLREPVTLGAADVLEVTIE